MAIGFPISVQVHSGLIVHILESRGRIGRAGFERFSQQQPWLPQGLAAATVPGIVSAVGMADSGLALFESLSYRTFSVGENGFTWAGSRFDRPESELRELRSLLQVSVVDRYIAIAHQGGNGPTRSAINQTPSRASP